MKSQEILSPFEKFDPLDGMPTHHFFDQAEQILYYARRGLKGRTREQIQYMLESLNYMMAYRDPLDEMLSSLDMLDIDEVRERGYEMAEGEPLSERWDEALDRHINEPPLGKKSGTVSSHILKNPRHSMLSPVAALRSCMPVFDIENQEDLPEAKWSEYFAALALALIGESVLVVKLRPNPDPTKDFQQVLLESRYIADYLLGAMESIGDCRLLEVTDKREETNEEAAAELAKRKERKKLKHANIVKHTEKNRIKRDFIYFIIDEVIPALRPDQALNHSEAARRFYLERELVSRVKDDGCGDGEEGRHRHKNKWERVLKDAYRAYKGSRKIPEVADEET